MPELSPSGMPSADDERELVDRARDGDREALGLLYDAYLSRLYRYCLTRVGNETDAEDLTEEIFVKVLVAIERFEWQPTADGQRVPFGAWIFRIARNEVASHQRRLASRPQRAELSESIRDERRSPHEIAETKIAISEVFAAVRELSEAQREVILLRFAAGLSVAETADALGKKQTNVKVLQHKGIKQLKRLLVDDPALSMTSER